MSYLRSKISHLILIAIFFVSGLLFFVNFASAQTGSVADSNSELQQGLTQIQKPLGLPATDIRVIAANIIRAALGLLGIIVLVLMIYAGYLWMTAGGNEEKITEAKKILRNATIGLIIILSAYAIVSFVMTKLVAATNPLPTHCTNGVMDEDETKIDCGGSCGTCSTSCTGSTCPSFKTFYVMSLPAAGDACIRNVHPAIVFNKAPDLSTVNNGGITITKLSDSTVAVGTWRYFNDSNQNVIVFDATGDCGGGTADCFDPSTEYQLSWPGKGSIKTADADVMSLMCNVGEGCNNVVFKTGANVDRIPPTITINDPKGYVSKDSSVWVNTSYTDDNGVAQVWISIDDRLFTAKNISGCKQSGTADLMWSTADVELGTHKISATAVDKASYSDVTSTLVQVRPLHCYDTTLDEGELEVGPPACGPACGACAGDKCSADSDCASGYCDPITKLCINKMKILRVSPLDGAPNTFVSIAGSYFGTVTGSVYFSKVQNPRANSDADWVQASLAPCSNANTWLPWQAIVTVPSMATSGPIKVVTVANGTTQSFLDTTNDVLTGVASNEWGPKIDNFEVNDTVHPGLCSVNASTGGAGDLVALSGQSFGTEQSVGDSVKFGELRDSGDSKDRKAVITGAWQDAVIDKANVPTLDKGWVGTAVFNNSIKSNVLAFEVLRNFDPDAPLITNITPDHGANGEYITITGKNFGQHRGSVWLRVSASKDASVINADDEDGNNAVFSFPEGCGKTWNDNQIIFKFPKSVGVVGHWYSVQVHNVDNDKNSVLDGNTGFTLSGGQPAPGICSYSPAAGPVPLAGSSTMDIIGEYFASSTLDANNYSNAYFWSGTASSTSIDGRLPGLRPDMYYHLQQTNSTSIMRVRIPSNAISGSVVIHRDSDPIGTFSNPVKFTKQNCVEAGLHDGDLCADSSTHCCATGGDAGACVPNGTLCKGQRREAGYMWMFSTKNLPEPPRLIERCNGDTDQGKNLPSPSPSTQWTRLELGETAGRQHEQACLTSLISLDFSGLDGVTSLPVGSVEVRECDAANVDLKNHSCNTIGTSVPVKDQDHFSGQAGGAFVLENSTDNSKSLKLQPDGYNGGKWQPNTWYWVVLKDTIMSSSTSYASSTSLAADKPCGVHNPYCFLFKTGDMGSDCRLKTVVITPYSYWTKYLEQPLMQHDMANTYDLYYSGNGLSDQYCILMDVSGFNWQWGSNSTTYADIYNNATSRNFVQVSTFENTVGVGLPLDAVGIWAHASTGTDRMYANTSSLKIDLSNPQVVDYEPKCLETCTNATVWAKWNVTMSLRNLTNDSVVQLRECKDENCTQLSEDNYATGATLDANGTKMILNLNSNPPLKPNTIYQVILSASSTDSSNPDLIWSRRKISEEDSSAYAYGKQFKWRFKTKNQDCLIDHTTIDPENYTERKVGGKKVYQTTPYSSPDSCSSFGQELSANSVSWAWGSSDVDVAKVFATSTRGKNIYCTSNCLKRGSEIPAGYNLSNTAVCGNGILEAGEDCDLGNASENAQSCALNCLRPGNTNTATCGNGVVNTELGEECDPGSSVAIEKNGCNNICLRTGSKQSTGAEEVGSSICGNGMVGFGEDCDLGVSASSSLVSSSLACSGSCLHLGSKLSSAWCFANQNTGRKGFATSTFKSACENARSQCGDGLASPDEDKECELSGGGTWASSTCSIYCLKNKSTVPDAGCVFVDDKPSEGCNSSLQHKGSSLMYSQPSVCGDGAAGTGEDEFCDNGLSNLVITNTAGKINPWALVTAVGMSNNVVSISSDTKPFQLAYIGATTTESAFGGAVGNKGKYKIPCGYTSDAECQAANGGDLTYAVGSNSCCYHRPQWISHYPSSTAPVCPNTYIEVKFDQLMSQYSAEDNFVVAQGIKDPQFGVSSSYQYSLPVTKSIHQSAAANPTKTVLAGNYLYNIYKDANLFEIIDVSDPDNLKRKSTLQSTETGASIQSPIGLAVAGSYAYITSNVGFDNDGIEVLDIINPEQPKHRAFYKNTLISNPVASAVVTVGSDLYIYILNKPVGQSGNNIAVCKVTGGNPDSIGCTAVAGIAQSFLNKADKIFAGILQGKLVLYLVPNNNTDKVRRVVFKSDYLSVDSSYTQDLATDGLLVSDVLTFSSYTFALGVSNGNKLTIKVFGVAGSVVSAYTSSDLIGASSLWFRKNFNSNDGFLLAGSMTGNNLGIFKVASGVVSYFGSITNASEGGLVRPKMVVGDGDVAYVGSSQIKNINVLDLRGLDGTSGIQAMASINDKLYVSDNGSSGLGSVQTLSLTDPLKPVIANDIVLNQKLSKLVANGNVLYGTATSSGMGYFSVIDIGGTDARSVTATISKATLVNASNLAINGNYAYVVVQDNLAIIDITTSSAPVHVANAYWPNLKDIKIVDNVAYVVGTDGYTGSLRLLDLATSTSPVSLSVLSGDNLSNATALDVQNGLAYIVGHYSSGKLSIVDVSSSTNLKYLGDKVFTYSYPTQIKVIGKYAYVAGRVNGYPGVYVFDVTSSTNPVMLASTAINNTTSNVVRSMEIVGSDWYLALSNGEIKILDINSFLVQGDCFDENDVTGLVAGTQGSVDYGSLPWYEKLWNRLANFVRKIFVSQAVADVSVRKWCVNDALGKVTVVPDNAGDGSRVLYYLNYALEPDTQYAVILKDGLRDMRGVSVGFATTSPVKKNYNFRFTTGEKVCKVSSVSVTPAMWAFQNLSSSTIFQVEAFTGDSDSKNVQQIQPVTGYYWDYIWGPTNNEYVNLTVTTSEFNTVSPKNKNGETDIAATANVTRDDYDNSGSTLGLVASGQAHIVVFLCNNPWPPNNANGLFRLPYCDSLPGATGNTKCVNDDSFDLSRNVFTDAAIPAAVGSYVSLNSDGGYFNFSSLYCMDSTGATSGNLPFLRPVVQNTSTVFNVNSGVCSWTGTYCDNSKSVTAQCQSQFTLPSTTYYASSTQGICYGLKNKTYSYYLHNNQPLYCGTNTDCLARVDFHDWHTANGYEKTGYCRVPTELRSDAECVVPPQPLKRFLFTNQKNNDAIGIQIFLNPKSLTAEQWFSNGKISGGQGFVGSMQSLTIDGYKAVRDNNNIYVDVFNASSANGAGSDPGTDKIFFSNIFLFSINADAQAETRQVFEQFISNLKFNTNLSNYGYCGGNVELSGVSTTCKTDFDCKGGEVCANQKTKLQRNYQRLRDLKSMQTALDNYFAQNNNYPTMRDGSYLPGQTISTWPAWTVLGNQLGKALSVDPINKMPAIGTCLASTTRQCTGDNPGDVVCPSGQHCVLHATDTGWSAADRRFSFACHPSSSVYRYFYTTSTDGFQVRAHFEEPFKNYALRNYIDWTRFKYDFIGTDTAGRFIIDGANGICDTAMEISTVSQGTCGDGQINVGKGEQCDPKGIKDYDNTACTAGSGANSARVRICGGDCKWGSYTATSCPKMTRNCGNGIKEVGEACDQGSEYNGTYNHCNANCTGFNSVARCGDGTVSSTHEICDINQPRSVVMLTPQQANALRDKIGICTDGVYQGEYCKDDTDCESSEIGACKLPDKVGVRYGKTKAESCNFDCQARGPYCGDGIYQPEFGEECDGDQSCTAYNGQPGVRKCLPNCKRAVTVPDDLAAWWKFDSAQPLPVGATAPYTKYKFYSYKVKSDGEVSPDLTDVYAVSSIDNTIINACNSNSPCWDIPISPELPKLVDGYVGPGYDTTNKAYLFGEKTFASTTLLIDQSAGGNGGKSLTYMAWVYPTDNSTIRRQIFSADLEDTGWSLLSAPKNGVNHWQYFNNNFGFGMVDTGFTVDVNRWQHIAVVYDRQEGKVKFYKHGGASRDFSGSFSSTIGYRTASSRNGFLQYLYLGTNAMRHHWVERMNGAFDEMMVFNKAVTQTEIDQYVRDGVWQCKPLTPTTATPEPPKCGNGVVESDEACDAGTNAIGKNLNGIACTPAYGKTCTYCSAGCKNKIDVQPKEYCGDGKVQSASGEQCEAKNGFQGCTTLDSNGDFGSTDLCNANCKFSGSVIKPDYFSVALYHGIPSQIGNLTPFVNASEVATSSAVTVSVWAKPTTDCLGGVGCTLVYDAPIVASGHGAVVYLVIFTASGRVNGVEARICPHVGMCSELLNVNDINLPINEWHHYALVAGPLNTVSIYVDGVKKVSELLHEPTTWSGALADLSAGKWYYGSDGAEGDRMIGDMRSLLVWKEALPSAKILDIYRAGPYRCDEF